MFETDADRLAMIRGLGGVVVSTPAGSFEAILDADHAAALDVDSEAPRLTARSVDVARLGITRGMALNVGAAVYVVRSPQPDGIVDAGGKPAGMTTLILEGP
jgi:hypothetical protein